MKKPTLEELLLQFGQECNGATDCGLRDEGGAVHGCRCGHCVAFRRFQSRARLIGHSKRIVIHAR